MASLGHNELISKLSGGTGASMYKFVPNWWINTNMLWLKTPQICYDWRCHKYAMIEDATNMLWLKMPQICYDWRCHKYAMIEDATNMLLWLKILLELGDGYHHVISMQMPANQKPCYNMIIDKQRFDQRTLLVISTPFQSTWVSRCKTNPLIILLANCYRARDILPLIFTDEKNIFRKATNRGYPAKRALSAMRKHGG